MKLKHLKSSACRDMYTCKCLYREKTVENKRFKTPCREVRRRTAYQSHGKENKKEIRITSESNATEWENQRSQKLLLKNINKTNKALGRMFNKNEGKHTLSLPEI